MLFNPSYTISDIANRVEQARQAPLWEPQELRAPPSFDIRKEIQLDADITPKLAELLKSKQLNPVDKTKETDALPESPEPPTRLNLVGLRSPISDLC